MGFFVVFVLFWSCFVISIPVAAQTFNVVKGESAVNVSTATIIPTLTKSTGMAGDLLRNSCWHRNQKRPVKKFTQEEKDKTECFRIAYCGQKLHKSTYLHLTASNTFVILVEKGKKVLTFNHGSGNIIIRICWIPRETSELNFTDWIRNDEGCFKIMIEITPRLLKHLGIRSIFQRSNDPKLYGKKSCKVSDEANQ